MTQTSYYVTKLNPVLRIGSVGRALNDDLKIVGTSPLYATIFLPIMFACWHASLQVEVHN